MQGEKREVPTKSHGIIDIQMKAFITEIRMELESNYCVWLLSYFHFCVAEPAKPPLHKMHIMAGKQH